MLIRIDCSISAPGQVKEVIGCPNSIEKLYIYKLMSLVQLPGKKQIDSHIIMHPCTKNNDVILDKEFQNHQSK